MNPDRLLALYERIADTPDAVARLRRFILDLAVRGRLVPQDPEDEPAGELLMEAEEELRQHSQRPRKQNTQAATVAVDDRPFETPPAWVFVRLGAVLQMINGRAFKPTDWTPSGLPIVRIQNLNNPNAPFNCCDPALVDDRHLIRNGEFLISWSGTPGTSFGAFIWSRGSAALNQHIFRCVPVGRAFFPEFLRLAINSQLDVLISQAQGGVGLQHVTKGKLEALPLPLPPLPEQHRIVAKVDELMALCDRLEAARAQRESTRDRLAAASLARLNAPDPDPATFTDHARFALDALPALTTRADQIKQLRQTILNLAVRGKLVPQDTNDEPAAELLKRLSVVKAQLIAQKKIKKEKHSSNLEKEKPFLLPKGWEWVRMQAAFDVRDGTHDTPKYVIDGGVPLITSRNFANGKISFDDAKLISWSDHESIKQRSRVDKGDILYSMIGGNIGNQVLVDTDREFSIKNVALFKYYSHHDTLPDYLNFFLKTVTARLQSDAAGGAQPFVSLGLLRSLPFPMPPIAEQHRIVAKVDELMALCDRLEASLATADSSRRRLLDTLLHEALAPAMMDDSIEPAEALAR